MATLVTSKSPADATAFIRSNLSIGEVARLPGLRLYTAHTASGLSRFAAEAGTGAPYWAYPWAGGLALAQHIKAHPQLVRGRRVLDLGAGSGLVGIAAARAGAAEVIAAETDATAIAALALNAALNDVSLTIQHADLTGGSPPAVDLVLVGDLFYGPKLARRVMAFLVRCSAAGCEVLVGDPWRAHLPSSRLRLLASYELEDFGATAGNIATGVFQLAS